MARLIAILLVLACSTEARADVLEGEPDLTAVTVGKRRAFAVGKDGAMWSMELARGTWTKHRELTRTPLLDVAAVSDKDVWAVGIGGFFVHFDGDEWVSPPGSTSRSFFGVAFADRRRGVAVGEGGRVFNYVRSGWQPFQAMVHKPKLLAVTRVGRGRHERFVAVGAKGAAIALSGVGASIAADLEITGTEHDLTAIDACGGSKAEAVAVGGAAMLRDQQGRWGALPEPPATLTGVALRCKRGTVVEVFATAGAELAVYDVAGRTWTTRAVEGAGALTDIAWANKKQLLVVGDDGFWQLVPAAAPAKADATAN